MAVLSADVDKQCCTVIFFAILIALNVSLIQPSTTLLPATSLMSSLSMTILLATPKTQYLSATLSTSSTTEMTESSSLPMQSSTNALVVPSGETSEEEAASDDSTNFNYFIIFGGCFVLLLLLVLVIMICFWFKLKKMKHFQKKNNCTTGRYVIPAVQDDVCMQMQAALAANGDNNFVSIY